METSSPETKICQISLERHVGFNINSQQPSNCATRSHLWEREPGSGHWDADSDPECQALLK